MKRFLNPERSEPIAAGMYHGQWTPEGQSPYRIHLRLQPDGSGVLVVNASTVLHLNPTAAEYAYHFIKGTTPNDVARLVGSRYRVSRKTALQDFRDFAARVEILATTVDVDPVAFLDVDRVDPHTASLAAPLRLDCALTYRLPADRAAADAPAKRVDRELSTAEWIQILDSAWQAGIPHVTFTGGEATLRDDLVELIRHTESIGQVCGLLTDGLKLSNKEYLGSVLQSGLDHILFLLQPTRPDSWKALETVLAEDIFVTVHLTVTKESASNAAGFIERLASLGCRSLSLSFSDPEISDKSLADAAAAAGMALKHDLPVPYSADNPVSRELAGESSSDGAGKSWLYVEPDGDVLPAQGMSSAVLGNMLRDSWQQIYHP